MSGKETRKYWLHRISYLENVSYPLLDKGYLSIGFSDFCNQNFFDEVVNNNNNNMEYFNKSFEEIWGSIPRGRYSLWRFLIEMKKGDWVVVPSWGTFFIYEICDSVPIMASDESIDVPECDWNGNNIVRDKSTHFLKIDGKKEYLDIGFLRKVKLIAKDISRNEYADAALTSRMKIQNTNADISDLQNSIQKALSAYKSNKPINLKSELQEKTIDNWADIILKNLNPDKYEKLVKWYFIKVGASEANIPPKKSTAKAGDVDVIAVFENIRTIINVQVKFYEGETSTWPVEQIKEFAKLKENNSDGYNRQYWVISSSDNFSDKCFNLAKENNILLINGKQFVSMLMDAGIDSLDGFED